MVENEKNKIAYRLYLAYFQAPDELQDFFEKHKFAQRKMTDGNDQRVHHTNRALNMIHEEIIRLELSSLDKNRLKRNAETGRSERDSEVYTQSARWVGFFGEEFVNKTMFLKKV